MPIPPPPSGGRAPGQAMQTADGRPLDLTLIEDTGRALSKVLKPGTTVTGRVIEQFHGGSYLFSLRGRNLVADSRVPLLRDSVVRFAVLDAGDDGIQLRMLDGGQRDSAATSGQGQRLAALGLQDQPAARAALMAFEDGGAPLDKVRLARAAADIAQLPADRQGARAAAHATLARAGLPTTPVLLATAEQTLRPGLPNSGQALAPLVQHRSAVASAAPTPSAPPSSAPAAATSAGNNALAPTASPIAATQLPTAHAATSAGAALAQSNTHTGPGLAASASLSTGTSATTVDFTTGAQALPDPGLGGRTAAAAALDLAGVRAATPDQPAQAGNQHSRAQLTLDEQRPAALLKQLVALAQQLERIEAMPRATVDAMHTAVRESVAETLLPPANLDDFDLVLPLPLQDAGHAVPGRIAITKRRGGRAGHASFVRIDLELQKLGPLSVRLNAVDGAPLSIILLATGHAIRALNGGVEDLHADLEAARVEATIRVDDLLEHGGRRG